MQLGTRWPVGGEAPSRLPAAVVAAVRAVEEDLRGRDTAMWRWTLTWLEGRPIVELDDGTVIRYNSHQDSATTLPPPDQHDGETPDDDAVDGAHPGLSGEQS